MVKIFAVTGPASSGKSTLLNALSDKGIPVNSFKVARSIQSILGYSNLQDALDTPESMIEFQETILEVKYQNDMKLLNGAETVVLVERSFADIYAYAHINAFNLVARDLMDYDDADDFLFEYRNKCDAYQEALYTGVIAIPPMQEIEFVGEAQRGAMADVPASWDVMEEFLSGGKPGTLFIKHADLGKRVDQVLTALTPFESEVV